MFGSELEALLPCNNTVHNLAPFGTGHYCARSDNNCGAWSKKRPVPDEMALIESRENSMYIASQIRGTWSKRIARRNRSCRISQPCSEFRHPAKDLYLVAIHGRNFRFCSRPAASPWGKFHPAVTRRAVHGCEMRLAETGRVGLVIWNAKCKGHFWLPWMHRSISTVSTRSCMKRTTIERGWRSNRRRLDMNPRTSNIAPRLPTVAFACPGRVRWAQARLSLPSC